MAYIYDLTDTWNAGGTTFNAIKMNVTDSASASASKLVTLQTNGTEHFSVTKGGVGYFSNSLTIPKLTLISDTPFYTGANINSGSNSLGIGTTGASQVGLFTNNAERMRITDTGNVGIGTSSPAYKLEAYKIDTSGARTSPVDVASVSAAATYSGEAYTGFGAGLVFKSANYNTATPQVVARIRSKLNDDSVSSFGSSLVFDVTTTRGGSLTQAMELDYQGNLGIGTAFPTVISGYKTLTLDATTGTFTDYRENATLRLRIGGDGGTAFINGSSGTLRLLTSDQERMRLDASGNVMVGTTSANSKFLVTYSNPTTVPAAGAGGHCAAFGTVGYGLAAGAITNGNAYLQATRWDTLATNYNLLLQPNGGNVGIGTTAPEKLLSVSNAGANGFEIEPREGNFSRLISYNRSTAAYTPVYLEGLDLRFFTGSGSERMRIDSAGNVGIGTTTPESPLQVQGRFRVQNDGIVRWGSDVRAGLYNESGYLTWNTGRVSVGYQGTGAVTFETAGQERARITAAGELLVNRTSTSGLGKLNVEGGADFTGGNVFFCRDTGSVLVGTTSESGTSNPGIKLLTAEVGPNTPKLNIVTSASTNATAAFAIYSTGAAAYRFYVDNAGTIFATSSTISAISDQRLKENVRDLDSGLDKILALKPRRFDWKEGKGKDVRDDMGFIAQEVEEVMPELIGDWKAGEGVPDDLKSVKAGDLIPVLVKAIQELTARVAQLEGN
jgi:hypothetical protein